MSSTAIPTACSLDSLPGFSTSRMFHLPVKGTVTRRIHSPWWTTVLFVVIFLMSSVDSAEGCGSWKKRDTSDIVNPSLQLSLESEGPDTNEIGDPGGTVDGSGYKDNGHDRDKNPLPRFSSPTVPEYTSRLVPTVPSPTIHRKLIDHVRKLKEICPDDWFDGIGYCHNDGICYRTRDAEGEWVPSCRCNLGWEGHNCESPINSYAARTHIKADPIKDKKVHIHTPKSHKTENKKHEKEKQYSSSSYSAAGFFLFVMCITAGVAMYGYRRNSRRNREEEESSYFDSTSFTRPNGVTPFPSRAPSMRRDRAIRLPNAETPQQIVGKIPDSYFRKQSMLPSKNPMISITAHPFKIDPKMGLSRQSSIHNPNRIIRKETTINETTLHTKLSTIVNTAQISKL